MPMISVIMPAYNHEKYIGEAIESVINQSYTDFEFIIINDGSTDNTDKVIKAFSDKRIRYFSQSNKDAPNTINRGISLSKGKYISIINSDDVYHKNRLETLLEYAQNNDLLFLFTDTGFINEQSDIITDNENIKIINWKNKITKRYKRNISLVGTFFYGNMTISTSNFFFNRSVLNSVEKFNNYRYVHDYDFILRILYYYEEQTAFLDQYEYCFYRIHDNNTIKELNSNKLLQGIEVLLGNLYLFLSDNKNREFFLDLKKQYLDYLKNNNENEYDLSYIVNYVNDSATNYSKSVNNKDDKAIIDLFVEKINKFAENVNLKNNFIWRISYPIQYLYLKLPPDIRDSKSLTSLRYQYIKLVNFNYLKSGNDILIKTRHALKNRLNISNKYSTEKTGTKVLIYGRVKTGTTILTYQIANSLGNSTKIIFEPKSRNKDNENSGDVVTKCLYGNPEKTTGVNTSTEAIKNYQDYEKKIWIARDPRDQVISDILYRWYKGHNPSKNGFEMALEAVKSKERDSRSIPSYKIDQIQTSARVTHLNELKNRHMTINNSICKMLKIMDNTWFIFKYEDLVDNNFTGLNEYLGFSIDDEAEVPEKFNRVRRSKTYGNWRDWFTEEDVEFYKPLFNEYMQLMNYDTDDWELNDKPVLSPALGSIYMEKIYYNKIK